MNFWLNPIPLRRTETAMLPGLSQLLRQYPRGLVGATHRHLPKPRVQHACKLVLPSGGSTKRLHDTAVHSIVAALLIGLSALGSTAARAQATIPECAPAGRGLDDRAGGGRKH